MKSAWVWIVIACCVLALYISAMLTIEYIEVKEPSTSTLSKSQLLQMHYETRQRI